MDVLTKTCPTCEYTWDARTWTRCPRCCGTSKPHEPSPAEIRAACLAIQRTWTPGERRKRTHESYRVVHADTPQVARVGDGMRRRDAEDGRV